MSNTNVAVEIEISDVQDLVCRHLANVRSLDCELNKTKDNDEHVDGIRFNTNFPKDKSLLHIYFFHRFDSYLTFH
jgi:hypothetical protein